MSRGDHTKSRQSDHGLIRWLAVADAIAVGASLAAAAFLHGTLGSGGLSPPYAVASAVALLAQLLFFHLVGLYDLDQILAGTREYARIMLATTYNLFLVVGVSYFAGGLPLVARRWVLFSWVLVIVMVGAERFVARRVVRRLRRDGWLRTRVLVVGGSASGVAIARELAAAVNEGIDVRGFLDEYAPLGRELLPGIRVVGRPADLARNPGVVDCDECVLVGDALPYQRLDELTRALVPRTDVSVRLTVGPLDLLARQTLVAQRSSVRLLALRRAEIIGVDAVLKRLFDIVIASAALLLLAPALLVAATVAIVRRRRPVVQVERIYGRGGEAVGLPLFTHAVGDRLLLRGSLAFLAVLGGRLSIVGPRPQPYRGDNAQTPLTLQLTTIKPGLTGPWRLSGAGAAVERQATDDLTYIRGYNIWEDVRIVLSSLRRSGARSGGLAIARWQVAPLLSADAVRVAANAASAESFQPHAHPSADRGNGERYVGSRREA